MPHAHLSAQQPRHLCHRIGLGVAYARLGHATESMRMLQKVVPWRPIWPTSSLDEVQDDTAAHFAYMDLIAPPH